MTSIGDSIRGARKAKGITLAELGTIVGTDSGNLSRIEKGKQGASQQMMEKICAALGMSLSGLISASTMRSNVENTGITSSSVPVILMNQIATWIRDMDTFKKQDAASWIACPVDHGPRTFATVVTGESMNNPAGQRSFRDGDYIFCDPDKAPGNDSLVIARMSESSQPLFRQLIVEGDNRYLQAVNPSWPDRITALPDQGTILGTVIFRGQIV